MGNVPIVRTGLDAATTDGATGSAWQQRGAEEVAVEVHATGQPDSYSVVLEARETEGTATWTVIETFDATPTSDPFTTVYRAARGFYGILRTRLVSLVGGASPTITTKLLLGGS